MSLIAQTQVPLLAASARDMAPRDAAEAAPPSWARLDLGMQRQLQDQWCWAAVSTSIAHYFGSSGWTQCSVVSEEFDNGACCVDGSSAECNRPWYLDKALERVDVLKRKQSGMPDLDDVFEEIDRGRPVGIRIGWSGGGGHFVTIEGYQGDRDSVAVEDPWYGASDVPVDSLRGRYQGSGRWTHTYYTRKP
jgi:Papain-like cysteine protease AvrRpt2